MKQFIFLLIGFSVLLMSCNNKSHSAQNFLTGKNLTSSFIILDADSAYSLQAPKGAILKIAKNSFDVKNGEKIQLEIKEAYTATDILLAGLTTKSNGRLLQSGGMIYINVTENDKAVKIVKPINVSIPSEAYDERMQLFKGEVKDDSSINWVDPQPLDTAPAAKNIISGGALFKANCSSCHKPTMEFTAPALEGCRKREPGRDWAYRFTINPMLMIQKDEYTRAIFNKYNKTQMTAFPNLTLSDVNAILDYCDNVARLNPMPSNNTLITDSISSAQAAIPCFDSAFYPLSDTNIQVLPIDTMPDSNAIIYSEKELSKIPMYQFNIDRSGWYNVDCFIDNNRDLVSDVNLTATLNMPKGINAQVYLCIPGRKLLTQGFETKNGLYEFYNGDGKIQLILNDEAIIFAFASDSSKAYCGITRFNVQTKQQIVVNLKESTEKDILSAIKSNKLDGVKIEIDKPQTYIRNKIDLNSADSSEQKMEIQIFEIPCGAPSDTAKLMTSLVKK